MTLTKEELLENLQNSIRTPQSTEDGAIREKHILVKDIFGTTEKSANGKEYEMIHLEYRDLDFNSLQEKKTPIFIKEQAELLLRLEVGQSYSIQQIKEEGYWVWKTAQTITE